MDEKVEVHIHNHYHTGPSEEALQLLHDLGEKMTALSDAVDAALASEADEDARNAALLAAKDALIADLQAQLEAAAAQVAASMANDAADAQTIADTQAALDAQAADTQAQIDRLNAAFPPVDQGNVG